MLYHEHRALGKNCFALKHLCALGLGFTKVCEGTLSSISSFRLGFRVLLAQTESLTGISRIFVPVRAPLITFCLGLCPGASIP